MLPVSVDREDIAVLLLASTVDPVGSAFCIDIR